MNENENKEAQLAKQKLEQIFQTQDREYWSLYEDSNNLEPLKFSNGKTQEDVVKEVVSQIKEGKKIILLHGVCGTGKSAIALNIARVLGKTCIVVPIKNLQKQYEQDYMSKKYLLKKNCQKMKISMITGRDNHDSIIMSGRSCAYPFLPDTIKITEKNHEKIKEYYLSNPYMSYFSEQEMPPIKKLRRISIAPANPYWSPILPADIELYHMKDAKKKRYKAMYNKDFIFYHRKQGCSYYDQYQSYIDSDVIIFNSAKYLAEVLLGRKPFSEVDIIDEADEFLDNLAESTEINLTLLSSALRALSLEGDRLGETIKKILNFIQLEEINKKALGIDENKIFPLVETKIVNIFNNFLKNLELQAQIEIDELNYANNVLEAAKAFEESFNETYLTYRREDENLFVRLVTVDLSKKFAQLTHGNKAMVLMSGTLHSQGVLKNIFGIKDFVTVEAESNLQGTVETLLTGKEIDCRYDNFKKHKFSREDYLKVLSSTVEKAERPVLVHVNAYKDLPSKEEADLFNLTNLTPHEKLKEMQELDKNGNLISIFKQGLTPVFFTTRCSRGVDFPGDMCKSVVFTKYPNPDAKDTFWKVLQKIRPAYYWELYKDKARREFLQRIYRAVRSPADHVYVLSPDVRVLNAVKDMRL
ncbi:DEAD/DEAH box helicase family protein [Candidatus Pacearchaeota archaeon]|nr:DEAD/DEAH box helicase family protein [Candidatus Pacearchaeota archaeon]